MNESDPAPPPIVIGTLVAPLLGVTFEPLPDEVAVSPDVRILPSAEFGMVFGSWDEVPVADNETLASATHAVELPNVTLLSWPDRPGIFQLTDETKSRLTDVAAMLCLERRGFVGYAEAAVIAPIGAEDPVSYSFLLRDFASRLDAASMFEPEMLTASDLARALGRWRQLPNRHPSLRTAAARLLSSWQREPQSHDMIVDLCIAIEALVGDGSNELVTRISLRAAAMLASVGWRPSSETAKAFKDIYAYRSQVVHGAPGPYKQEMVRVGGGHPTHAVRFALAALLNLLEIYFDHEDLSPARIDGAFIFAAFDSAFEPEDRETEAAR